MPPVASLERPSASAPTTALSDADSSDVLAAVRAAIASDSADAIATLMHALDTDDGPAKIESIDELVRRKHLPMLDRLIKLDPAADPFVGPTAILGIGSLAHDAAPASREAAVARLAQLIAQEKARQGTDSPGNLLLLFEALGAIGSESSARVLERELFDAYHDVAPRVAIVEAIEACGRRSSTAALRDYQARFVVKATEPFELALEKELEATLARAMATLGEKG